ncbi:membrane dipeptidase [Streptomyces sp. NBC_01622]|uniref:membrane dipeptidase n=1 Tax=Streptomyces sp. NBC_01622 TaxID=2975903 RepID=UPI0038639A15|nr:membrane dipeptidase [Streptomyces sp. NBC_01622]
MPNGTPPPDRPPMLWEGHCCLPLERQADVGEPDRYRGAGGGLVSVNVGYAPHGTDDVTNLVASRRERIAADDRLRLVATVGGCLDAVDEGLTGYGRALVRELNDAGMVADGSHCGARTASTCAKCPNSPSSAAIPACALWQRATDLHSKAVGWQDGGP